MRVPQAPQNANPAWTPLPQLGHGTSPGPTGAPDAGAGRDRGAGAGVGPPAGTDDRPPAGGRAPPPSGLGGDWKGIAAGTFGESFQGMPPLGRFAGAELRSSPAAIAGIAPVGDGGNTVRAVSRGISTPWVAGGTLLS